MICGYGRLFQLYSLPYLNPHYPQFITKSYGASCLYAHKQATEAQLSIRTGNTLHAHTNYNFGRTHRHKFTRLVPLGCCACILREEFMKIYSRSHKMSFIQVHILQRQKAEQMLNFLCLFAACKHK